METNSSNFIEIVSTHIIVEKKPGKVIKQQNFYTCSRDDYIQNLLRKQRSHLI